MSLRFFPDRLCRTGRSTAMSLLVLLLMTGSVQAAETPAPTPGAVWVIPVEGAIGPATSDFVVRGFEQAHRSSASLIILQMNTPGGLDGSMRDIIQSILSSRIPVVSWVGPKGARAASAGTYISYASHIAAMAPATNLGAATPVQIAAPSLPSPGKEESGEETDETGTTAMERKMVNDASAYIRGLAELRGRNIEWAEQAVREAVSLSASEALERNVIDLIAGSISELVHQLDGYPVAIDGQEIELSLAGKPIFTLVPDWRTELLTILTDPNLILVLGMIGIYGIILEFYNPGATVPGVVGVICLILAGYSLQLLPVDYAGLVLLLVGIFLMIGEAMVPSFGMMGIGGIVAFLMGGLMLFDSEFEAFQLGLPVLGATAFVTAGLIFATISIALKIRRQAVVTGVETLIGKTGRVLTNSEGIIQARIGAEIWTVVCDDELQEGDRVRVVSVEDMHLVVNKLSGD